jgi:hypothetical protein
MESFRDLISARLVGLPHARPMKTLKYWLRPTLAVTILMIGFAHAETYTWTGTVSSDWHNPANWNPNTGVPGLADTAVINSGAPVLTGETSVAQLELKGGSLGGAGTLTVTNTLEWSGISTMTGGGTTVIGPGAVATLSGEGDRGLVDRTLINQGTLRQPGPCRLTFYNAARVENQAGGLVDWQGDVNWTFLGSRACTVTNAGTIRKSGGAGTSGFQGLVPNHTGRVEARVGTVHFPDGLVATGLFEAAAGAVIRFQDTSTLTDVTLSGPGEQRLESGTHTLVGNITAQNLVLADGTWQGTNTLNGLLTWVGGVVRGPGSTTIGPQGTWRLVGTGDRSLTSGVTLINQGVIEHTGTCRLTFYNAARVENQAGGLVDVQGDVNWTFLGSTACSVSNAGSFRKSAGTGTCAIQDLDFSNTGTLGVWQGILNFTTSPSLSPTTTMEFGLQGTMHPEGHGRITSPQLLRITGHLAVLFRSGFTPGPGQRYDVITAPVQGVFGSYTAPSISPTVFINPEYRTDGVSLVTTDPTPTIYGLTRLDAEGQFHLSIHGVANLSYVVLGSTDFAEWIPLATNALPASTLWEFIDTDRAPLPFRFYRVFYQQ